jgi:anti-anti-sigma factor
MRVADVMTSPVLTVGPDAPWKQVAERMLDADVSGLPVTNDDGYLMGVVTEADLVSKPAFGTRWAAKATALTAAEFVYQGPKDPAVVPGDHRPGHISLGRSARSWYRPGCCAAPDPGGESPIWTTQRAAAPRDARRNRSMDGANITHETGTTLGFGYAVTHVGNESLVRVWGGCDSERAWLLRECLEDLVDTEQRRITLDVADLGFADFTAVAILVGALARIRQVGAEVAVSPQSSGAYRVLKRADPTTARAVSIR